MNNRSEVKLSTSQKGINVFEDTEDIDIAKLGFDFAIGLVDNNYNPLEIDNSYLSFDILRS